MSRFSITPDEAAARLRTDYGVKSGSTIYTTVKHVSRSGMSRTIAAYVAHKGQVHDVSHLVANVTGMRFDRDRGGVVVGGCGMDMTFHLVYSLSRGMFPKGHRCNGTRKCHSNDHTNDYGTAMRRADDELERSGDVAPPRDQDANYLAWFERRRTLADRIRERDGLTYRKGRVHSDGGYALTRGSL